MNGWDNFFFAEVGASAALAGLIFVGVSINLTKILSVPKLPSRALLALALLLAVLITSSLMLVPGQTAMFVAIELLVVGLCIELLVVYVDINTWRNTPSPFRRRVPMLMVMNQLAVGPYFVAGVMVMSYGFKGLYWLVPGILFSFLKALLDAWVLLVEINR